MTLKQGRNWENMDPADIADIPPHVRTNVEFMFKRADCSAKAEEMEWRQDDVAWAARFGELFAGFEKPEAWVPE